MTEQQNMVHDYFRQEGFLPVDRESYSIYRDFYDKGENLFQEMTAMITATATAFSFIAVYKVLCGHLCTVWFYHDGKVYFCIQPPSVTPEYSLGQAVDTLYGLACAAGLPSLQLYAIEDRFLKNYENIAGYTIETEYNDDYSEYAYRTRDLLELSGGINFYKRKRLKKCFAMPNLFLRPMTKENFHICFEIEEKWCGRQDCSYCESFIGCEKVAIHVTADIFDEQIYTGTFLYQNEEPIGYAICEKKDSRVAFLYYAKTTISDFSVYLYYMIVKTYFPDVEYFNLGYDLGKTGLRLFKQHLSAYELWRKYVCTFTKPGGAV